ncbi:MAG: hypothetical protein U0802_19725 [Candidatus Binatia bacterium]
MANEPQHCPTCQTEYVAGIAACADCGGRLAPGPLERYAATPARGTTRTGGEAAPAAAAAFDAMLAQLPGLQADHAVKALLLEEIPCFVECQGLTKTYQPGSPPAEPFAVTLPVTVRVRSADLETAREIVASLDGDDLIGEQWSDEEIAEAAESAAAPAGVPFDDGGAGDPATEAPVAQGTSMVTAVVIFVVVVGLLFLFGR